MKEQQEAQNLINYYNSVLINEIQDYYQRKHLNKIFALNQVDYILDNFGSLVDGKSFYTSSNAITFYEQVKQEIENGNYI